MSDYQARILDAHASGVFPLGEVSQVEVEHGFGCKHHLDRKSPCTCHPRVTVLIGDEVLTLGSGGTILERRQRS